MADDPMSPPAGLPIDTGSGGFPVDGKAVSYDVGVSAEDPPKELYSPGGVSVDSSVRDLSNGTKKTLASYLSKTTLGKTPSSGSPVGNKYPIRQDESKLPVKLSLSEPDGHVSPIAAVSDEQPHFSDILPGRSNDATSLNILRGREKPDPSRKVDGNELLLGATDPMPGAPNPPPPGTINSTLIKKGSPIEPYTGKVLSKNLYEESTPYSTTNEALFRSAESLYSSPVSGPKAEDISSERKKTLSDYLGKSTREGVSPMGGNVYPVYSNEVLESRLTDEKGLPRAPNGSVSSVTNYVEDKVLSSRSAAANNLTLNRGRESNVKPGIDGHRLLRNATADISSGQPVGASAVGGQILPAMSPAPLASKEIKDYYGDPKSVSTSLIYNRFNPNAEFLPGSIDSKSDLRAEFREKMFAKKYPMGKSLGPDDPSRDVSQGRLAQIGTALTLRATSELGAFGNGNPTGGKAEANAILPGVAQLGLKRLTNEELSVESVIASLTTADISDDLLIDVAGTSWGSLNNPHDQFAGITSFGMQLLAVALLIAFAIIITIFAIIFSIGSGGKIEDPTDSIGRLPLGSSQKQKLGNYSSVGGLVDAIISGEFDFWSMVGVSPTYNDKNSCLPVGALLFFGVNAPGASPGSMAALAGTKGLLAVVQSPGYYSVMARTVNRSLLTIGDAFVNLGKSFGNFLGNPVAAVKQLLGVIEVLRESKLMKFINVFCKLGDLALVDEARKVSSTISVDVRKLGKIDTAQTQLSIQKNRLDFSKRLSWSTFRAPDMLLMSPTFVKALSASKLAKPSMSVSIKKDPTFDNGLRTQSIYNSQKDGRISTEDRERLEDFLEAEYVPFYIQDVRTNEILGFHAFLASLTDGYTANYDSTEGFGRVEAVKTYKSTNRKIDFSFYIASTSTEDFDSMWLKINKLATLVYPQFSEGRTLNDQNGNILYAPFSQTIQASPLIRVRIGDLIKSNYSKFGLSRLFGYGEPGTSIDDVAVDSNSTTLNANKTAEETEKAYSVGNTFISDRIFTWDYSGPYDASSVHPPCAVLQIVEKESEDRYRCKVIAAQGDDILDVYKNNQAAFNADKEKNQNIFKNVPLVCSRSDLRPSRSTTIKINSAVQKALGSTNYVDKFTAFMDDEGNSKNSGNAVVKSFRTSGGKGIAGFIDSLNFDWYDRTTWETTEIFKRAPKMCKVSVSFSPIHDITPGLDHLGMNRAPVYPVGPMATYDMRNRK